MSKWLPVAIPIFVIFILVCGFVYIRTRSAAPSASIADIKTAARSGSSDSERIKELEVSLGQTMDDIDALKKNGPDKDVDSINAKFTILTNRLQAVELELINFKTKVAKLEINPTTATSAKSVTYIPTWTSGSAITTDWSTTDTYEITINPDDFPGHTSMQFEVAMRVYQGNGKAYARLVDSSSTGAVLASEVSTASQNYTWLQSPAFTLPSGKKTYKFQLKSQTGYEASIQNSRIRVNF